MSDIATGRTHSFNADLLKWAKNANLDENTLRVLEESGFTTLALLANLGPEDIMKYFYDEGHLNLAQCLALKAAVRKLNNDERKQIQLTEDREPNRKMAEGKTDRNPDVMLLEMFAQQRKAESYISLAMPFVQVAANLGGMLLSKKLGLQQSHILELPFECSYSPGFLQFRSGPKSTVETIISSFLMKDV